MRGFLRISAQFCANLCFSAGHFGRKNRNAQKKRKVPFYTGACNAPLYRECTPKWKMSQDPRFPVTLGHPFPFLFECNSACLRLLVPLLRSWPTIQGYPDSQVNVPEKLEKAGTVYFKQLPAQQGSVHCLPKVRGRFAFPGAPNPEFLGISRFGESFPEFFPALFPEVVRAKGTQLVSPDFLPLQHAIFPTRQRENGQSQGIRFKMASFPLSRGKNSMS